jgi:hypothetical protein
MNEAASSVEPEVKTRFATVDDAAFERPQMQFPVINLTRKIARWTSSCVRGSNKPSKPIRIKKIQSFNNQHD